MIDNVLFANWPIDVVVDFVCFDWELSPIRQFGIKSTNLYLFVLIGSSSARSTANIAKISTSQMSENLFTEIEKNLICACLILEFKGWILPKSTENASKYWKSKASPSKHGFYTCADKPTKKLGFCLESQEMNLELDLTWHESRKYKWNPLSFDPISDSL